MKTWVKYLLIFAIIGFILGYIIGAFSYIAPECEINEPCMGQPNSMFAFYGAIIGAIIGLIVSKFKIPKKTN